MFKASKVTFPVLLSFLQGLCIAQADEAVRGIESDIVMQDKALRDN